STVKSGLFGRQKQVVIVRGGPGTGKSVLAINLMAELLREGRNAQYATGSRAFTETLWEIIGSRSRATFRYFNSYGRAGFNEVEVQFRCAGSDGFVNWIDNTLGIRRTANVIWDGADGFDFRIVDSPQELEAAIRECADRDFTARVAAGFCWPWSEPQPDGTLVEDVVIGDYRRPWDAKPGNWRLAPGIPPASLWATDPNGINQIGCVYNIRGFELDYVGVIWGKDLRYDLDRQEWVGDKTQSADSVVKRSKEQFVDLVKNTYRVLLSRGLKGCYVFFMDRDTERFVHSRM